MIASLLIANRGEIACRIIRTARAMGIRTVAVYSDADAHALHVRQADEAVHIGPPPARESYLVGDRIIAAARETGAEAIHPGYGFLSENADFARDVIDAGLIWVGPRPDSIRAMGLKDAAKERMIAAGVPVTPGYFGADQSPERLRKEADTIGYPVLIKAVAGGGGKGMRRVDRAEEFADALASCRREAASSFGDDRVLIEKYILSPRHIEVQVFGDTHGNVVHLFERDCSLQRRHQKVIEEAPAPGMDEATRETICAAAVRAAKAVDYVGAGTIEFIADAGEGLRADRIWFMEMNTRLQVEHPVTEQITGVDLVEWQLRVASGEPLPKAQEELSINGWAIEARLYAEDPVTFLPSIGVLEQCHFPEDYVRIETGFEQGSTVSPFYDPMIAKIITHADSRENALALMAQKLEGVAVWPVKSNAGFLYKAVTHPSFVKAEVTTAFIAQHAADLAVTEKPGRAVLRQAAYELVSQYDQAWRPGLTGFRLNGASAKTVRMRFGHDRYEIAAPDDLESDLYVSMAAPDIALVTEAAQSFGIALDRTEGSTAGTAADGAILAPMPGRIISLEVTAGDRVAKGQKLVTLEAMKMEHGLVAPFDGIVAELDAEPGAQVSEGRMLARIEKAE
ncbi:acetyl/propionyl/methylcrotonyl-CoA carboxylase subunit alpha [Sphingomonas sp. DT-204]|uniref:acetyl/propionyl/methylcrotonyl-CoA carboxylase subunit alpha n=1 Tax=Sphingomonas sp. DT-204 TaxID=3396166 RepID=UPI003F1C0454